MMMVTETAQQERIQLITIDNALEKFHSEYEEFIKLVESLESIYSDESVDASLSEGVNEIRAILDKSTDFAEKRQYTELYHANQHCAYKINEFHSLAKTRGHKIPKEIYKKLRSLIDIHINSLDVFLNSLLAIKNFDSYSVEHSRTKDLELWANALESLGDVMEDNIGLISIEILQDIQPLFWIGIERSQHKTFERRTRVNRKDSYRIRIRNASGFISSLIDNVVEQSEIEEDRMMLAVATANHPIVFEN
jgi:hypothetical protein